MSLSHNDVACLTTRMGAEYCDPPSQDRQESVGSGTEFRCFATLRIATTPRGGFVLKIFDTPVVKQLHSSAIFLDRRGRVPELEQRPARRAARRLICGIVLRLEPNQSGTEARRGAAFAEQRILCSRS